LRPQLVASMRGTTSANFRLLFQYALVMHGWSPGLLIVVQWKNRLRRQGGVCSRDWVAFEIIGCLGSPGCAREASPSHWLHIPPTPQQPPRYCLLSCVFFVSYLWCLSVSTCPPHLRDCTRLLDAHFLKTGHFWRRGRGSPAAVSVAKRKCSAPRALTIHTHI
jgi:hypothetical protein